MLNCALLIRLYHLALSKVFFPQIFFFSFFPLKFPSPSPNPLISNLECRTIYRPIDIRYGTIRVGLITIQVGYVVEGRQLEKIFEMFLLIRIPKVGGPSVANREFVEA